MRITIYGHNLPGRRWCSSDEAYDNVHVGIQEGRVPVGLVPGDATSAAWDVDVQVSGTPEGQPDFKGPAVHGKRGERFLYLTWGDVKSDQTFVMFRRAKLMLGEIERRLLDSAVGQGRPLFVRLDLTDRCGGPRCARVRPPDLTWALE